MPCKDSCGSASCCQQGTTSSSKKVAIIGTREPSEIQSEIAAQSAEYLSRLGFDVSTGAADGIDSVAMANAHPGRLIVYQPWASYNLKKIPAHARRIVFSYDKHEAWALSVKHLHPAPQKLSGGAFALHARNYGIVEDSRLVIALPNETGEGGTGQGIRVAESLGIPVWKYVKGHPQVPSHELDNLIHWVSQQGDMLSELLRRQ